MIETLPPTSRQLALGCAIFALIGAAAMAFLNGPVLTDGAVYNYDLVQSPHWVAFHSDSFAPDDFLVEYGSYNESPVQNVIYWVGTLLLDLVLLNKVVGIVLFGLTAALFYGLASRMMGLQAGTLAGLFFILFPRSAYEISGGFSKAWAIGFVLIAVYVVDTRKWSMLLWTMPLAALAYPVSPVLMGGIAAVGLLLEARRSLPEAIGGLKRLAAASALAIALLGYKYAFVSRPRIGEMISTSTLKQMWEQDEEGSRTLGLWRELVDYLEFPFFVYTVFVVLILSRRCGLVWRQSWTALAVASTILYYVSDLVVPQLYLPDRYSRFSVAVLVVLWYAANGSRILEAFKKPWAHRTAALGLVVLSVALLSDTFRPGDGGKDLNRWRNRRSLAPLNLAIAAQPEPIVVAGHPYYLGDVLLQAKRPVLMTHRMFHPWYDQYWQTIDTRLRDTFRAFYSQDVAGVNRLAETYGVTHLILNRSLYDRNRLRRGRVYEEYFDDFVLELTKGKRHFALNPPPLESVVYSDGNFTLVRLPLPTAGTSGDVSGNQVPEPAGQGQR